MQVYCFYLFKTWNCGRMCRQPLLYWTTKKPNGEIIIHAVTNLILFPCHFVNRSCLYLCFRSRRGLGVDHALCHWGYFVQDVGSHLTGTKVSTRSINHSLIIHNFLEFKNIPTFIPHSMSFLLPHCSSQQSPPVIPRFRFHIYFSIFTTFLFPFHLLLSLLSMFNSSLLFSIWLLF